MPLWQIPPDLLSNVQVVVDGFPSEEEKKFVESLAHEKLADMRQDSSYWIPGWLIVLALNNGFPEELLNDIWEQPEDRRFLFIFSTKWRPIPVIQNSMIGC